MDATDPPRATLAGAHLGYEYQDLVGACLLAVGVVDGLERFGAEAPTPADPVFDDFEVAASTRVARWQIKHSTDPGRRLTTKDLVGSRAPLSLAAMARAAAENQAVTRRILATWGAPNEKELAGLLVPAPDTPSAFSGWTTTRYRLSVEAVWPRDGNPAEWTGSDLANTSRAALVALADQLIIELNAPPMSKSLHEPAKPEQWLLNFLADQIGIGRFPNERMVVEDAAAQLIRLATRARSRPIWIGASAIQQALRLESGLGRLDQRSPVQSEIEVRRRRTAAGVLRTLRQRRVGVLTAGPGAGKSWGLDEVKALAERAGVAVAYHYCYLTPDDSLLEERIKGDRMIANLVAGLVDAIPELAQVGGRFAADLGRIERLLEANAESGSPREILLIVDGLDHVSRVRVRSSHVSDADADLVERLASLALPQHAHLLVASQPGSHLEPLIERGAQIQLEPWTEIDIDHLLHNLGLTETAHLASQRETIIDARAAVHDRAAGSPLYATYLVREIRQQLHVDPTTDLDAFFESLPNAAGDLGTYYQWLLDNAVEHVPGARDVAILLGLADFGLTADDLRSALPVQAPYVDRALAALTPLLSQRGPAYKVHHESFQRFIVEGLSADGVPLADAVRPLVEWLRRLGFYEDARSFRFLPPTLQRSGQASDALRLVGPDFVAEALAHGYPDEAIGANLALAADAAAATGDWPAIAACAELARANDAAWSEKLYDIGRYASAYVDVYGPDAVVARLLFEGAPAWPRRAGLRLCRACDEAGGVPPWDEYLKLPSGFQSNLYGDEDEERLADRAAWLGQLRAATDPAERAVELLRTVVERSEEVRDVLGHLARVAGVDAAEAVLARAKPSPWTAVGWLAVADVYASEGDSLAAAEAASKALPQLDRPVWQHEALDLGGDPGRLAEPEEGWPTWVEKQARELEARTSLYEDHDLAAWTVGLRALGATDRDRLRAARGGITKQGFYFDVLRFFVDAELGGIDGDMIAAYRRLSTDVKDPGEGPRLVDITSASGELNRAVIRSFDKLPEDQWPAALDVLSKFARVAWGYGLWALLDLVETHMDRQQERLLEFAVAEIRQPTRFTGDVYSELAETELRLARLYARAGHDGDARACWLKAANFLAAYGYRKDVTVFELIESLALLATAGTDQALYRAARLQKYATLVVDHTDGAETSHAPRAWIEEVAKLDTAAAGRVVGRAMRWHGAHYSGYLEDGLRAVLRGAAENANPRLLEALASSTSHSDARLRAVERLLEIDWNAGERALVRLHAAADGDPAAPDEAELTSIDALAARAGVQLDLGSGVPASEQERQHGGGPDYGRRVRPLPGRGQDTPPPFPAHATLGSLLRVVRSHRQPDDGGNSDRFVLGLGYRLLELAQAGNTPAVGRVLRAWARGRRGWEDPAPLVAIGDGLARHGHTALAAQAFALAWAHGRQRWWQQTGGTEHAPLIVRARVLDAAVADQALAHELAFLVWDASSRVGISSGLVGLFAALGKGDMALAVWDAAAEVIFRRLPAVGREEPVFAPLEDALTERPPLDVVLAELLATRIGNPYVSLSREALAGFLRVAVEDDDALVAGLRELLLTDTQVLVLEQAMQVGVATDTPAVGQALASELRPLAAGQSFLLHRLAGALLQRAGEGVPPRLDSQVENPAVRLPPGGLQRAAAGIDWGDRLELLSPGLPDLEERLTALFTRRWDRSLVAEPRSRERYRLREELHRPGLKAEVRLWHEDLFEASLQDALGAELIDAPPQSSAYAHSLTLPPVRMVSAWTGSRTCRPRDVPVDGQSVAPLWGGRYAGWWRVGWFEYEITLSEQHPYEITASTHTAGAMIFADRPFPANALPFGDGDSREWWAAGASHEKSERILISPNHPLVTLAIDSGPWGLRELLMLPRPLAESLPLHAERVNRLALLDDDGAEAVRFRRWAVRPQEDRGALRHAPRLRGCDLLIRDDVWQTTNAMAVAPPRWKQVSSAV